MPSNILDWLQQYLGGGQAPAPTDPLGQLLARTGDPEAQASAAASQAMEPVVGPYLNRVASGAMTGESLRESLQSVNDAFANQDYPGLAGMFSGGGLAARVPRAGTGGQPAAPMIGRGSDAPLFDYSRLAERPDVPQYDLPVHPEPPKGMPAHITRIADPENLARVNARVAEGLKIGGPEWYNIQEIRKGMQGEQGAEAGQNAFTEFTKLLGPTSQNTNVVGNLRNATYLQNRLAQGGEWPTPGEKLPSPWGMMDQTIANARQALESGFPLTQPKTARYSEGFTGNQRPYVFDRHMSTLYDLRDTKGNVIGRPEPAHYGWLEDLGQEQAAKMGINPMAHQAGGWLTVEGVRSPREPFLATVEARIRRTADALGEDPRQTLQRFYRLGLPGGLLSVPFLAGTDAIPDDK